MSAWSDLQDVLRRHAIGSQAELTVDATTAAMVLRALSAEEYHPRPAHIEALRQMLERIDDVSRLKSEGHLTEFVDEGRVPRESLELVQVMARAAHQEEEETGPRGQEFTGFPVLESLVDARAGVAITGDSITVLDQSKAKDLATGLEELANEILEEAVSEDRDRLSHYAAL